MFLIINYFKQRRAALVFFITFLVYSPLLLNHYVGDDNIIIGRNTFYHSWKNVPRVFTKGCISDLQKIQFNSESQSDFGTGKDSYRPISNLTYFLDYYLFRDKPYGSHLINILIHCINSVLVYWIVDRVFFSSILGFFAGLLFSLHPIGSEAVAVISYRADILATMFVLCSFSFWIKFKQGGYVRRKYYYGALAMYFLALFSKEAVFILPLVILLFDQMLAAPLLRLRQRGGWYIGFIPIFIFFLYLYLIVFPPPLAARGAFHWLGGSFINHFFIMGYIWYNYLINILMPWTVKMIPGHYHPPVFGLVSLLSVEIVIILILFITTIYVLRRNHKECAFFLLWYILFYLPLSNLIPIANPMACRYMYLPSVGILIVLAFFLHKVFNSSFLEKYSQRLSGMLHVALIMICVTRTLFLNADWKSNWDVGWAWVRDYPNDAQGYSLLGREYWDAGSPYKAQEYLEKSILLGDQMPSDVLILAKCYMQLRKDQAAKALLNQIILRYPQYADPFSCLRKIYADQNNSSQAQRVLERALILNPNKPTGICS